MRLKLVLIGLMIGCFVSGFARAEKPTIVANPWVTDTKLNQYDLVRIFTRKDSRWRDGHKITVFIKTIDSIESRIFIMDVLNLTPHKYQTMLDMVVYAGETTPPIELASDTEMISNVEKTPYSIGYLSYAIMCNINDRLTIISYE